MDFTVDNEKLSYIKKNLESVVEDLNGHVSDYYAAMNELKTGWYGLSMVQYMETNNQWAVECTKLAGRITEFKDVLGELSEEAGGLLERGKKLTV